jgi:hypothetical protein
MATQHTMRFLAVSREQPSRQRTDRDGTIPVAERFFLSAYTLPSNQVSLKQFYTNGHKEALYRCIFCDVRYGHAVITCMGAGTGRH